MSKPKVFMPLLGGLGNQLFQLSAALSVANGREILLTSNLGNQRRNVKNLPEIQSLVLPEHVKLDTKFQEHRLCTIIFNRLLTRKHKGFINQLILRYIGRLVLSIHFHKIVRVHISNDVGYDEWKMFTQNEVGIGYFQSHRWTDNYEVFKIMHQLRPTTESDRFLELRNQMQESESLVIHIRRGDYLNEPGIGMLESDYYLKALEEFDDQIDRYWIFSDQPQEAKKLLPEVILKKCVFVQPSELSTIETWELMRYGERYIISNSTFSWWSARLSYTVRPVVITPTPWFAKLPDPKFIIPLEWKEIPR